MTDVGPGLTSEVLERDLRALVAELAELDIDAVKVDVPFRTLGIDSLLAMEIAVHVEERYRFLFEEQDIRQIQTIQQMVAAVLSRNGRGVGAR
jgi:acyl carrier protein